MSERSLKKRTLGKTGVDFVRQQLLDGGPLSERFLERLGEGHVWEFYFDGRSIATTPEELGYGGQFDANDCAAQGEGYIDFFVDYLNGDASRILLFENQLARMSDPFMLDKTELFEFERVTYFYYPRESASADQSGVASAMNSASNYPYIMLATHACAGATLPQRCIVPKDFANEIETQTEHLLVGAFDGEGYVVWSHG